MTPADIITRLKDHERDHANHKAAVHSWLIEAGFHPDLSPCRAALCIDLMSVWCGAYPLSSTRAVEISSIASGQTTANLTSYAGHRVYHTCTGASPLEALQALAASGKVPKSLLKEKS